MCVAVWMFGVAADSRAAETQPTSAPAVSPQRVAALIAQLGDASVTRREQASRELAKVGLPAVAALRRAAVGDDPEIAARAKLLLTAIPRAAIENDACLRWKAELPAGRNLGLVAAKDTAVFHGGDGKLHGLSLADGSQKWEREWNVGNPFLSLLGDTLVCHSWGVPILALDPASGKVIWQSDVSHNGVDAGDGILIGFRRFTEGGPVEHCGLSLQNGSTLWRMNGDEVFGPHSRNGQVVCLTRDAFVFSMRYAENEKDKGWRNLVAVDPATGKKLWTVPEDSTSGGVSEGQLYLAARDEADPFFMRLTAYDLKTGQSRSIETSRLRPGGSSGHVQVAGNYVLYGGWEGVRVYDLTSGKWLWSYVLRKSDPVRKAREAVTADGTGFGRWVGFAPTDLPPVVHDGAAVLSRGDALLGVDLATGAPRWKHPVNGVITWGPVERGGVAYVIVYDIAEPANAKSAPCRLYAIDLTKAALLNADGEEVETTNEMGDLMRRE